MRRRKRIAARFWLFLLTILMVVFLIVRPYLPIGDREAVVMMATSASQNQMDVIIIREETVFSSDTVARVEYEAQENSLVQQGDIVAYLYATGYSESLLTRLETTRENIQAYHKTLLENIIDNQLNMLDDVVNMMALEFREIVNGRSTGNFHTAVRKLETAMVNRQEYMRQHKREDTKLTKLYEEENSRLANIASWRTSSMASTDGVVSFYLDGYENDLGVNSLATLTAEDVKTVLAGGKLPNTDATLSGGIYRLVNQDRWYFAIVADAAAWNPVTDQVYYFQLEGFEDIANTATVVRVQKEGGTVLAVFQVNEPMGSLIYQRSGKATLSVTITGLSVEAKALAEVNGQVGVWLYDVPGGTFVPVDVLSSDGKYAVIKPQIDGSIQAGSRVLIK
ncbi:MAG: HlyD family efflux transporter periplasmic adaptor subunit [Eubacteriales bacterium]|nr:HlyD family efflux transporter periplasmic adaptor subunit [Eubacteriales bacterium]